MVWLEAASDDEETCGAAAVEAARVRVLGTPPPSEMEISWGLSRGYIV